MNDIQNLRNPIEVAEYFSNIQIRYGFKFDFSLESLEKEVDRFLENNTNLSAYVKTIVESLLTAYIGETICRLYQGKWCGEFCGPLSLTGSNYYLCWIEIGDYKYKPSHFIEYYLEHGKENEDTFYNYLYNSNKSQEIHSDFLGGGLLNKIKPEKK